MIKDIVDKLSKRGKMGGVAETLVDDEHGRIEFLASYDYSGTLINADVKIHCRTPDGKNWTSTTRFLNRKEAIIEDCDSHVKTFLKRFEKEKLQLSWFGIEMIGYEVCRTDHLILVRVKEGSSKFSPAHTDIHIEEENGSSVIVEKQKNFLSALMTYGRSDPLRFALLPQKLRDRFSCGRT